MPDAESSEVPISATGAHSGVAVVKQWLLIQATKAV